MYHIYDESENVSRSQFRTARNSSNKVTNIGRTQTQSSKSPEANHKAEANAECEGGVCSLNWTPKREAS